jgi:hypothetical protein
MKTPVKHAAALFALALGVFLSTGCALAPVPTAVPREIVTITAVPPASREPTVQPNYTPTVVPAPELPTLAVMASPIATRTNPAPTVTPTLTRAPVPTTGMMRVKLFLIVVNDNDKSGKKIGCGDSVVWAERPIPITSAPLTAALKELLGLREQYYGESKLYNALYQSNLKLEGVAITGGRATINLSGTLNLGGTCDAPRVASQIQETALQFPTVTQVAVFLNGVPLEQVLSQKGG